ncbi:hypothetical protein C8R44DRAFT_758299, partial [Mycena epipterygia]
MYTVYAEARPGRGLRESHVHLAGTVRDLRTGRAVECRGGRSICVVGSWTRIQAGGTEERNGVGGVMARGPAVVCAGHSGSGRRGSDLAGDGPRGWADGL